jgi:hypothetical protein
MFSSRCAEISEDVDIRRIKSRLMSELVGTYDTYLWSDNPLDLVLVDPYSKFFFVVTDLSIMFNSKSDDDKYCFLPYIRMIWVAKHRRGKGIQRKILDEMKDISDDVAESYCIVADPFKLDGAGPEVTAYDGIRKLYQNDTVSTDNYMWDLVKQRERFIGAGLDNVEFGNASITEPYQHFVYVSKNETPDNISIFKENTLNYIVNTEKIGC